MIGDPNGEMLKQVTRIADAVSRAGYSPWIDWIKTIASFIAGLGTAYLSLLLQGRSSDRREQAKMRRIVYSELAESFIQLDSMTREATEKRLRGVNFRLMKDLFSFAGESYMKENPGVFYQLPEGPNLTWIYHWFHTLHAGETYPLPILRSPLGFFSDSFKTNAALRKYFKQFAGADRFRIIEEAVQHYEWTLSLEDMIDAGMVATDPTPEKHNPDCEPNSSR